MMRANLSREASGLLSKGTLEQLLFVGFVRLDDPNFIHRILQHRRFDVAECGDFARGFIGGFLNDMADVALRPVPFDLMTFGGVVQTLPPIVICLAPKTPAHRFDDIFRIRMYLYAARLFQSFQAQRGGGDFCLLVGGFAEVGAERAPESLEPEQGNCRRARHVTTITQA